MQFYFISLLLFLLFIYLYFGEGHTSKKLYFIGWEEGRGVAGRALHAVEKKNTQLETMQHPSSQRQPSRLFDFMVVVGLRPNEDKGGAVLPFIKHLFPSTDTTTSPTQATSFMKSIPDFCFPDVQAVLDPKQRGGAGVERFSFVLTDTTGEKRWAYCQRTKVASNPSSFDTTTTTITTSAGGQNTTTSTSSTAYTHLCFCILTFIPCFSLFAGLLDEILALHRVRMGTAPTP